MTEKQLHKQICDYIKLQYPDVIFNTDMSGIKLTKGQATQAKQLRSSRGFPDIVVYEPRRGFHGLFLEVKKENPFRKDGKLKASKHLREQFEMMRKLYKKGYYSYFVWTFEIAKKRIDTYLNQPK